MARVGLSYRIVGFDELRVTLQSIGEALDNAQAEGDDIELTIDAEFEAVLANGMAIAGVGRSNGVEGDVSFIFTIKPTASMVLFIAHVMTLLPSRARVEWIGGWPIIHCPPHDDRDAENDPTPLFPNELEPA